MNGFRINGVNGVNGLNGVNGVTGVSYGYDEASATADFLLQHTKYRPKIAIICGSGLGSLADQVTDSEVFPYSDIPNFTVSTAPGHAGRLVFGKLSGKTCVCMQGRVHMYEGHSINKIVFPVRVFKCLGVEVIIVTNAAGALDPSFEVGDLMIIKDHVNLPGLTGNNPLIGPNDKRFGPRFPAMSEAYDKKLRNLGKEVAEEQNIRMHEGVYIMQSGPCYESVTECRFLRLLGGDVTGMSTVPEVITAAHCGMRIFGLTLITNVCITEFDSDDKATEEEVLESGSMNSKKTQNFMSKFVELLDV